MLQVKPRSSSEGTLLSLFISSCTRIPRCPCCFSFIPSTKAWDYGSCIPGTPHHHSRLPIHCSPGYYHCLKMCQPSFPSRSNVIGPGRGEVMVQRAGIEMPEIVWYMEIVQRKVLNDIQRNFRRSNTTWPGSDNRPTGNRSLGEQAKAGGYRIISRHFPYPIYPELDAEESVCNFQGNHRCLASCVSVPANVRQSKYEITTAFLMKYLYSVLKLLIS